MTRDARLNHLYAPVGDLPFARGSWTELIGLDLPAEDGEYVPGVP